jgi:hypothetical protein
MTQRAETDEVPAPSRLDHRIVMICPVLHAVVAGRGHKLHSRSTVGPTDARGEGIMLYTIMAVLLVLWLLGLITGTTLGGFIHALLVIAIVVLVFQLLSGRKVV